jgi:hypothetical protein
VRKSPNIVVERPRQSTRSCLGRDRKSEGCWLASPATRAETNSATSQTTVIKHPLNAAERTSKTTMAIKPDHPDSSDFIVADEIDELFGSANPNPDRIGCPTGEVLSSLARSSRPIDDPAYQHLANCSPCYQEFRALQQGSGSQRGLSPFGRARWIATVAAVLVLVAVGAWLYLRTESSVPPGEPVVAEVRVELDLRPYTVSRSPQEPGTRGPLELEAGWSL